MQQLQPHPIPGKQINITCTLFLSILYISIDLQRFRNALIENWKTWYIYYTNIHSFINVADGQRFNSNNICACKREVGQNRFISFSSSDLKKKIYMHVYLDKCSKLKINIYIICFCFVLRIYILHYHVYFYINHFIIFILSLNWYIYIYVKPMNSMVLDNKQYNTYSTIRVQNRLSFILLGYNKTIACNTRTFAWRSRSHTAHARI